MNHVSPVCLCKAHTAVLQSAGYYNPRSALCQGGVITVIRAAVGRKWVLWEEQEDSLERKKNPATLSLTGVKLCKYINTPRSPRRPHTCVRKKQLLINTTTLQLLQKNQIQLKFAETHCMCKCGVAVVQCVAGPSFNQKVRSAFLSKHRCVPLSDL